MKRTRNRAAIGNLHAAGKGDLTWSKTGMADGMVSIDCFLPICET
jgi:hypothetical protein